MPQHGSQQLAKVRAVKPAAKRSTRQASSPAPLAPIALQSAVAQPLSASPAQVLQLQSQYGNRAVQRLIQRAQTEQVQRAAAIGLAGGEVGTELQNQINSARGGGQPLDKTVGSRLGGAMDADFSGVRVHTDAKADSLNRSLSAKAFTLGSDVFFSRGAYNPGTQGGQQLLAHELTHVVQQGGSRANRVQTKLKVGPAVDTYEQEADRVSQQIGRGETAAPLSRSANRIQRYKSVTDYNLRPGVNTSHMFRTKEIDPEVEEDPIKHLHKIRYKYNDVGLGVKPPLNVADDDSMAIHDTAKEPKEFYAEPTVISNSNTALQDVGSWLKLHPAGNAIKVNGHKLVMVKPGRNDKALDISSNAFADFVYHRCINFAMKNMGKPQATEYESEVVFQKDRTSPEHIGMITPNNIESEEVNRLGKLLGESTDTVTPEQAKGAIGGKGAPTDQGKLYGTKAGKGQLDSSEKELGINKYARARVGEGYGTFSQSAGIGQDKLDYSDLDSVDEPALRQFTWGYHYAAVAAESLNGDDSVTLENYNRASDEAERAKEIFEQLKKDFPKIVEEKLSQVKAKSDQDRFKHAYIGVQEHLGQKKEEAEQAYKEAIAAQSGEQWFFRMQGKHKGQSFHEQQAGSGYFANPMTVRVRRSKLEIKIRRGEKIIGEIPPLEAPVKGSPFENTYNTVRMGVNQSFGGVTTSEGVVQTVKAGVQALTDKQAEGYSNEAKRLADSSGARGWFGRKPTGTLQNRIDLLNIWINRLKAKTGGFFTRQATIARWGTSANTITELRDRLVTLKDFKTQADLKADQLNT